MPARPQRCRIPGALQLLLVGPDAAFPLSPPPEKIAPVADREGLQQRPSSRSLVLAVMALLTLVVAIYEPVRTYDFVPYDDNVEVFDNDVVLQGLTRTSWKEAWVGDLLESSAIANYWKPLSTLSHAAVVEFFGLDAGAHHVVNVVLHTLNVLLLFALMLRLFGRLRGRGALGASLFVAALFAVHPVHLESVAWVAERSDVLGGLFWMLAMHAWVSYFRRPAAHRYVLAVLVYALGLCAKPTLVTFPMLLILLQVWPLGRLRHGRRRPGQVGTGRALVEILLPLALAGAAALITYFAHARIDSTVSWEAAPLSARLQMMLIGYANYLRLLIWPDCLPVLFPLRAGSTWSSVAGEAALLLALSTLVLVQARRWPCLLVGWLWFLGVIFPVSGISQAGSHAYASRFLYLSAIGIYMAVARAGTLLAERKRILRPTVAAAIVVVITLATASRVQVRHWRNGETLFSHAIECTVDNPVMHVQLALVHEMEGRLAQSRAGFEQALRMRPGLVSAQLGLVTVSLKEGDVDRAEREVAVAMQLAPDDTGVLFKLGLIALHRERMRDAIQIFESILEQNPLDREVRINLASTLAMEGRPEQAGDHYRFLLQRYPDDSRVLTGYGGYLASQGHMQEALEVLERALAVEPGNGKALLMAARARAELGR